MAISQTPLRNLFTYIRDLYDVAGLYGDFLAEQGNPKQFGMNAWTLQELIQLHAESQGKYAKYFSVRFGEGEEDPASKPAKKGKSSHEQTSNTNVLLSISKPELNPEPLPDPRLSPWLTLTPRHNDMPLLNYLDKIPLTIGKKTAPPVPSPGPRVILTQEDAWEDDEAPVATTEPSPDAEWDYFSNHPELKKPFEAYKKAYEAHWQANRLPLQLAALYDSLHTLYYEVKGSSRLELALSFGLVAMKMGAVRYRNYLYQVPLIMELKKGNIQISLDAVTAGVTCDAHFLPYLKDLHPKDSPASIEKRKEEILSAVSAFNSGIHLLSFYPEDMHTEFFDPALLTLDSFPSKTVKFFLGDKLTEGKEPLKEGERLDYAFHDEIPEKNLVFSFSPVIQTRIMEVNTLIYRDASNIIKEIDRLEAAKNTAAIPNLFKKMFVVGDGSFPEAQPPQSLQGELHFPKPYNKEQLRIIERIATEDALVVEGPPGTGKSHTIANIVAHSVANGLNILVVSQNAKALTVIRNQIPESIRDLSVAVLNEGRSDEMLKNSVGSIIANMSREYGDKTLNLLVNAQEQVFQKYSEMKDQINRKIAANNQEFRLTDPERGLDVCKPAHLWAMEFIESDPASLPVLDKIHYQQDTTGLPEKLLQLYSLASAVRAEDFALSGHKYLPVDSLLDPETVASMFLEAEELAKAIDRSLYDGYDPFLAPPEFFQQLDQAELALKKFAGGPGQLILSSGGFNPILLEALLGSCAEDFRFVEEAESQLVSHVFELGPIEAVEPEDLLEVIDKLIEQKSGGKNDLKDWFSHRIMGIKKHVGDCRIDGSKVDELHELKNLRTHLQMKGKAALLVQKYNQLLRENFKVKHSFSSYKDYLFLQSLREYYLTWTCLNETLRALRAPSLDLWVDPEGDQLPWLKGLKAYQELLAAENALQDYHAELSLDRLYHPQLAELAGAVRKRSYAEYRDAYAEYQKLMSRVYTMKSFDDLYNDLFQKLPLTVQHCRDLAQREQRLEISREAIDAALWYRKEQSVLDTVTPYVSGLDEDLERMHHLRADLFHKTTELIAFKAWKSLQQKVTEEQKAALTAWLIALNDAGRGYGKNHALNLREAAKHMRRARQAVPVWIMTIRAAITFFSDAAPAQFDLLIMDEASQCDISSYNLIFRSRRSIIVGDPNQTAVVVDSNQFSKARVGDLLERHFPGYDFRQTLNVTESDNSIYSMCRVTYPNYISLVEHFRCLPEIIAFSNQNFYAGRIIPLRTNNLRNLGAPVELIYVEDDPKDLRKIRVAERVTSEIERLIERFENREIPFLPTVGILTLDSTKVQHRNAIIRALASSDAVKSHEDELKLLVGTSREFQGDERQIIFLTIAASPRVVEKEGELEFSAPVVAESEAMKRIYNVAASRAIYRSVIVHSLPPEAVAKMKEDNLRRRLMDHYGGLSAREKPRDTSPEALLSQTDANLGDFGRQVCQALCGNGFREELIPQFKIGNYTLDFAICQGDVKIAIICDGLEGRTGQEFISASLDQQQVLERVNWKYYRLQSTEWYYKKAEVTAKLFSWLNNQLKA